MLEMQPKKHWIYARRKFMGFYESLILIIFFPFFISSVFAQEIEQQKLLGMAKGLLLDIGKPTKQILSELEDKGLGITFIDCVPKEGDKPMKLNYFQKISTGKPRLGSIEFRKDVPLKNIIKYRGPEEWLIKIQKEYVNTEIGKKNFSIKANLGSVPNGTLKISINDSFNEIISELNCPEEKAYLIKKRQETKIKISDFKIYNILFSELWEFNYETLKNYAIDINAIYVMLDVKKITDLSPTQKNTISYMFYKNRVADITLTIEEKYKKNLKKSLLEMSKPAAGKGQIPDIDKEAIKRYKAIDKKEGRQVEKILTRLFEKPVKHKTLRRFKLDSNKVVYARVTNDAFYPKCLNFTVMAPPVKTFYDNGRFKSSKSIDQYETQFFTFSLFLNPISKEGSNKCKDFFKGLWSDISSDLYVAPLKKQKKPMAGGMVSP